MFADDTFILCNANKHSAKSIRHILKEYEETSGQLVNYQKSSIMFNKTSKRSSIEEVT